MATHNLCLTLSELERLTKVFSAFSIVLWGVMSLVQWHFLSADFITAAWRSVMPALTVATISFGVFYKFTWKSPRVAKLMGRQIVHGVWQGTLKSDYGSRDGCTVELPIFFVIRQTYLTISIESFTASQEGESKFEALKQNQRTTSTHLCYVFELRRLYQGESKLTIGAGELRLIDNGEILRGHYWTNSPTYGDLELRLVCRDCNGVDCFEVAQRRWPLGNDKE